MRGFEYFPTKAANDLLPIILALGEWGLTWAKDQLTEEDYDVDLLMLYLERTIDPYALPGPSTTLRFEFHDLKVNKHWWLLVDGDEIDICNSDPGRDVDVYIA